MKLKFGTGGLRAVMGAGEEFMNVSTIQEATMGVAAYGKTLADVPKIAIAYDTRNESECFAKQTARVLALEGCVPYIYPQAVPTPMLSFAVRVLKCQMGICITASHNPREYNGYKVYGADGCQITKDAAKSIQEEILKADKERIRDWRNFEELSQEGKILYIPKEIRTAFLDAILQYRTRKELTEKLKIVYTPLNGTGLIPMTEMFEKIGITNVAFVEEQKYPDGNFPTCPYPNPEDADAMKLGISLCENTGADLLLATDPDSDRLGVAAKHGAVYEQLNGNQLGVLMLDYLLKCRENGNTKHKQAVVIKTIVTTAMVEKIVENYGVQVIHTLTGFKYIGEKIGKLEKEGALDRFLFGLEESCGYLIGPYVRDKDAVGAAMLVCEMADYYKAEGKTLWNALDALYETYGYYESDLETKKYQETEAVEEMNHLRELLKGSGEVPYDHSVVVKYEDYKEGLYGLPKSDVLKLWLADGSTVVIRPSGTEPKIKIYREKVYDFVHVSDNSVYGKTVRNDL